MYCHEIWVASSSYRANKPLWYLFKKQLSAGTIVRVTLRGKSILGFVAMPTKNKCTIPKSKLAQGSPVDEIKSLPQYQLDLHSWMLGYYGNPSGTTTSLFVPAHLTSSKLFNQVSKNTKKSNIKIAIPKLTGDQSAAISIIKNRGQGTVLIHGVTGSGKTRVYIEMALEALRKNKSVFILTPEIGLSAQLETEIINSMNNYQIIRTHSKQSSKTRKAIWLQCLATTEPLVIVGPRSALFLPLNNIGLIVIDEEHDDSYKQSQSPYYHAVRVASKLSEIKRTILLLGSATPSINDYFLALSKDIPIITLNKTALKTKNRTKVEIVNSGDKEQFVRSKVMSEVMLRSIESSVRNNRQALLFLNRRGTSRLFACEECSWEALCSKCTLPYIYHSNGSILRCHTCGSTAPVPLFCPECKSVEIMYSIPGTEKIISELNKLFPHYKVARFDSDNNNLDNLEANLQKLKTKQVDIIVGTQILVKGFDLPYLQFVGIVNADTSLAFPDYTSEEKMYQLLVQAIGRVNRGHSIGHVVVQTRQPNSSILLSAVNSKWDKFYEEQISHRNQYFLPPFCHVLKLKCGRSSPQSAAKAAANLKLKITKLFPSVKILGPSPSFKPKINEKHIWQLIIKSSQRHSLISIIETLPSGWNYDIDPITLL